MLKIVGRSLVFVLLVKAVCCMPWHASCQIEWDWPHNNCSLVESMIVKQIEKWNMTDCEQGEKCRYALGSESDKQLTATHTTPKKFYVDDLTIKFMPQGSNACHVEGKSRSETWYAVLDYGTNYCNLHNLIIGAGLDKLAGYVEKTSDSICTQYSKANCDVY